MKRCFKCGVEKDINEFYKHPAMDDGHLGKCKECTKIDVKTRYYKRIDFIKKYESNRCRTPKRKAKALEYQKTKRQKNPDKYKSHSLVTNAIRDGRLKKMPCEICGSTESEAHHDDYSKPLDVRWLCFKHHRKHHGQLTYED